MRSMRDLQNPEGGEDDVTIMEYPWRIPESVAEQESSLEPIRAGRSVRNGRTDVMNRRP